MRVTLADTALARQAGRFVWLDLDCDKPVNKPFITSHKLVGTPSFFVIDPADERVTAMRPGGMTLPELYRFLDQGESGVKKTAQSPAQAALARGDALLGNGRASEAVAAYREALGLLATGQPERNHALASLMRAQSVDRQAQACAETAAAEAPHMPRERDFAVVVLYGLSGATQGGAAPWAESARKILEPLAVEAVGLTTPLRDDRYQLYQQLMHLAESRHDSLTVARWGHRWLDEIEAITPVSDDERSALDVARVDAASVLHEPERVLPALIASEKAMPKNYNASLRLAQMASDAKRYDESLAACERALVNVTGPVGRTWILETKSNALEGKGDKAGQRAALEAALQSAHEIANEHNRDRNVQVITQAIADLDKPSP